MVFEPGLLAEVPKLKVSDSYSFSKRSKVESLGSVEPLISLREPWDQWVDKEEDLGRRFDSNELSSESLVLPGRWDKGGEGLKKRGRGGLIRNKKKESNLTRILTNV